MWSEQPRDIDLFRKIITTYVGNFKSPHAILNALSSIQEIDLSAVTLRAWEAGKATAKVTETGQVVHGIHAPSPPFKSARDLNIFVEEVTHLIHLLVNPMQMQRFLKRRELEKELEGLGLNRATMTAAILCETDTLSKADRLLADLEDCFKVPNSVRPDAKSSMRSYFAKELNQRILGCDREVLKTYLTAIKSRSEFTMSEGEANSLNEITNWEIAQYNRLAHMRESEATLEDMMVVGREKLPANLINLESDLRNRLIIFIENLNEETAAKLYQELGFIGLAEAIWLDRLKEHINTLDLEQLRKVCVDFITRSTGRVLEYMHYEARPGFHSDYKVTGKQWLAASSDDVRRYMLLERVNTFDLRAMREVASSVIDGSLENLWGEGIVKNALQGSGMFWDIAEGSDLGADPEYVQMNLKAIKEAVNSHNLKELGSFSQTSQMDSSGLIETIADNSTRPINADGFSGVKLIAAEEIHLARGIRGTSLNSNQTGVFQYKVGAMLYLSESLLKAEPNCSVANKLKLIGYANYLSQTIDAIGLEFNLLTELVAKTVASFVSGECLMLVDQSGFRGYSVYLRMPIEEDSPISIWDRLIVKMKDLLEKEGGVAVIKLLRCNSIPEICELVGYED